MRTKRMKKKSSEEKTPEEQENYGLPPVLTVDEVAAFLRLNRKTVFDSIKAGEMPGRKVGRRVVVCRDALLSWLSSKCTCCHHEKGGR
jgi:excisionase family DNA binding protein